MNLNTSYISDGTALLVSGFDPAGQGRGGLYAWDGAGVIRLDAQCTTGLRTHSGHLLRCLWTPDDDYADVLEASPTGPLRRSRVHGVGDPHDVTRDGALTVVVGTRQNQVVWFRADGTRTRTWQPDGEPDSWHLNSLVWHGGRLLVSAFGQFTRHKEWEQLDHPSGCLLDMETGRTVVAGLRAPHSPRHVDGRWIICNSAAKELLAVDAAGGQTVLATFDGWARGLLITDTLAFVGLSPLRHAQDSMNSMSRVAVLRRASWEILAEVQIPAREIYDLVLVTTNALTALRCTSAQLAATR